MKVTVTGNLSRKTIKSYSMKDGQFGVVASDNQILNKTIVLAIAGTLVYCGELIMANNLFQSFLDVQLYTKGSKLTIEQ